MPPPIWFISGISPYTPRLIHLCLFCLMRRMLFFFIKYQYFFIFCKEDHFIFGNKKILILFTSPEYLNHIWILKILMLYVPYLSKVFSSPPGSGHVQSSGSGILQASCKTPLFIIKYKCTLTSNWRIFLSILFICMCRFTLTSDWMCFRQYFLFVLKYFNSTDVLMSCINYLTNNFVTKVHL